MKLTNNEWLRSAGGQMRKIPVVVVVMAMAAMGAVFVQAASAQAPGTTTVQGTVYLANGHVGSGTLRLSWPSFAAANGQAVVAGTMTSTIGPDGIVSVNLAPNLGATPAGLYYTAVLYLSDGTTSTEYRWRNATELLGIFNSIVYQSAAEFLNGALSWEMNYWSSVDADDERIRGAGAE